jgi:RHS repeat-associated protein
MTRSMNGAARLLAALTLLWFAGVTPIAISQQVSASATLLKPGQSATVLPDGRVLLLGGGDTGASSSALLLDPRTGISPSLGAGLVKARAHHTATLLPDGRVLVLGGVDAQGIVVQEAEAFDPATAAFATLGDLGLVGRSGHTATLLTDGKVLLLGGVDDRNAGIAEGELWDPRTRRVTGLGGSSDLARRDASAMLLSDGSVLIRGGQTAAGSAAGLPLVFDPASERFNPISMQQADALAAQRAVQTPALAASLPEQEAANFPPDGLIALRFSRPIDVASASDASITLIGPGGMVPVRVVPSQDGMLAFLTPVQMLFPGTRYTVFVESVSMASGEQLPFHAFGFDTARLGASASSDSAHEARERGERGRKPAADPAAPPPTADAPEVDDEADESFNPDSRHRNGRWRTGRALPAFVQALHDHEPAVAQKVRARWARYSEGALPREEQGTGVAGQVLRLNDRPLRNVTVSIGAQSTRTDGRGRFRLFGVPPGRHEMAIDGTTAGRPGREFPLVMLGVDVKDGKVTELPHAVYLPRIKARDWVAIDSPTAAERVLTHPGVPGLEVRIPAGAVLRDRSGAILTRIAFVPLPMDRTPYPTPANFPGYFLLHPGGAVVQGLDPRSSQGIKIVYPNLNSDAPGTRQQLWFYDPRERGWFVYGAGRVTPDGKQVVPEPGVALYEAMGFSFNPFNLGGGAPTPEDAPSPGGCGQDPGCSGNQQSCGQDGDPVDCATGLFLHTRTELSLPDVLPISLTRTYRSQDTVSRAFGKGTSHNFAFYLHGVHGAPKLILPDGSQIRFAQGQHTATPTVFQHAVVDQIGNGIALGLPFNPAFRVTLKNRSVLYFAPGSPNHLIGMEDRNGNRLVFSSSGGVVTRIVSPSGRHVDLSYDASSRITHMRDIGGRTWTYEYDAAGYLSRALYPDGTSEEYTYDGSGRMLTVKDRRGNTMVTNVYDANGRVQQQTLADGGVYQFAYALDGAGKVTQTDITDPRGKVRRIAFNADGYTTANTDALGTADEQVHTFERQEGTNLLLLETDPLGRKTRYTYDAKNNVASITRMADTAEAVTESFTYEPTFNTIATRTDALNKTTTFGYDAYGNLTHVIDPLSNQVSIAHNTAGQPVTMTNGVGKTTQLDYSLGELVQITDPLNRITRRELDILGRLQAEVDPLSNRTGYEYDAVDQVTAIVDPQGRRTDFAYDGNGNRTSVTDAVDGVRQYVYDAKNRQTSYVDALGKVETYAYDGMDNLVASSNRKLQATTYAYDARNRPALTTFADASTIAYTYDAAGRLTAAADSLTGTVTRAYDNLDRLASETTPEGSIAYSYDAAGRRTAMTVSGQPEITYDYDLADRLTSITRGAAVVSFGYDAANRRTSVTLPNGVVATYGYDDASQVTNIAYARGGVPVGDLAYTYDAAGRRVQTTGSLARTGLPAGVPAATYDLGNRLTNWGGQPLTYDDDGNLLSDGLRTYVWDARNRLVSISGAAAASFSYDALGRRISKTVNGTSTQYLHDGLNPVQERSSGLPTANLISGLGIDEFFRRSDPSGDRDLLTDALGSTLALTDETGAIRTSYSYEPYGAVIVSGDVSGNPYQYTGRENDGTGVYYYRARFYHPEIQRFISEDPIDDTLNLYMYADSNPLGNVDPLGLFPIDSPSFPGSSGGPSCQRKTFADIMKELLEQAKKRGKDKGKDKGHRNNQRESNRERHEEGDARRQRDQGGERGDQRRPYRNR